jgi:hypothetical protein
MEPQGFVIAARQQVVDVDRQLAKFAAIEKIGQHAPGAQRRREAAPAQLGEAGGGFRQAAPTKIGQCPQLAEISALENGGRRLQPLPGLIRAPGQQQVLDLGYQRPGLQRAEAEENGSPQQSQQQQPQQPPAAAQRAVAEGEGYVLVVKHLPCSRRGAPGPGHRPRG